MSLVLAVVVLVGALSACTSSSGTSTDSLAAEKDFLEVQLSAAQATMAEQEAALDAKQAEVDAQAAKVDALKDEEIRGLREAKADAVRQAQAAKKMRDQDVDSLATLVCTSVESELPADVSDSLVAWLIETESAAGEVPSDLGVTIVEAAGRDGGWVFIAEFDTRFEPGLFSADTNGRFDTLYGGMVPAEIAMWNYLAETYPEGEASLAACPDLSFFVDS
jgi:hypothetical protein